MVNIYKSDKQCFLGRVVKVTTVGEIQYFLKYNYFSQN